MLFTARVRIDGAFDLMTDPRAIDVLIEEILTDAYSEDDQFWAFRQTLEDTLALPFDGFAIGEPVQIEEIEYDGNPRRGLTARCRKQDGSLHGVALHDISLQQGDRQPYLDAYRKWLGLAAPNQALNPTKPTARHTANDDDLDLSGPLELVVLSVKQRAARCRLLGSGREVTLRSGAVWNCVPGEILRVSGKKFWLHAGHPYLSGEILSHRQRVVDLGLTPLKLRDRGLWKPDEEFWGEEQQPLPDWAQAIVAKGPRPLFELELVIPGDDTDDREDHIARSVNLKENGASDEAERTLMELLHADLRCLDAHAHLGNFDFELRPENALRHYAMGRAIGELSLGPDFCDVLLWAMLDNRPYLRCLHGHGLCLWRLGELKQAELTFKRMLWFNPPDNQGARFLLQDITAGKPWKNCSIA